MPTVPVYDQQVQQQGLPTVRNPTDAPLESFGGGASAQGITQAGSSLAKAASDIFVAQKRNADQVAVLGVDQKLSAWETKRLYDPETGALNKKGSDSFGLPDEVGQDFKTTVSDLEGELNNDAQKMAFRRMAMSRGVDIERTVTKHVAGQRVQYDNAVTDSYLSSERDAAIANYNDPERIDVSIDRQRAALMDYADRTGMPSEELAVKITDATSKTHSAVMGRMLANGGYLNAKQYYADNKDDLTGADSKMMEAALEEGSVRGESQQKTDAIMDESKTRAESLAEARKIEDPKIREATEGLVNRRWEERRAEQKQTQDDLYMMSTNMVDKSAATGKSVREVIPPTTWTQLSLEQRNALENRGNKGANDNKVWLDFLDMTPQQVSNISRADFETKYWSKFDDSHRQRAETMWDSSRKKNANDPNLSATLTYKDRVENTVRTTGLIPASLSRAKFSEAQASLYANFEQEGAKRVQEYEVNDLGGKRKATGDEIQGILDKMAVQRVFIDKNWSYDQEKVAAFVTEDEKGSAYVPIDKIPAQEKNAIENILRSKGKRITSDKVQRAYGATILGDKKRVQAILSE